MSEPSFEAAWRTLEDMFPDLDPIVEEVRRAVATLLERPPGLDLDPDRVVLAGHSAGAHLAAMVATADPTMSGLAGLVLVSGIYELEPLIGTSVNERLGLDVALPDLALDDSEPQIIRGSSAFSRRKCC